MKPSLSLLAGLALLAACQEQVSSPTVPVPPTSSASRSDHSPIERYVAMGTSLSMGVMSNGVIGSDQRASWPAQLAELAGVSFTQPLIASPGCQQPLAAPLASLRRIDGTSPFVRGSICAPLEAGITAPTQNLAISEALTINALVTTPESPSPASWPLRDEFYSRVLGPNQTQLTAMLSMQPDLVSVEFGVNEVLGARSGLLVPGVTIVPFASWQPAYDQLIAGVKSADARVLLVGVITQAENFPSLRRGAEINDDREELSSFGIAVAENCGADARDNYVYVPAKVVGAYAAVQAARAAGVAAPPLSCADVPGTQDYVLTPQDMAAVNSQLLAMNTYIRDIAERESYAFFDLDPLYGRGTLKAPFSATTVLTSDEPFGPLISLDGVHPSAEGHQILAREAAKALNVTYHLGIPRGIGLIAQH